MTHKILDILWFDNDISCTDPFVSAMERDGCRVTVVESCTEAEKLIRENCYQLVILDVMIPTQDENEDQTYSADNLTDQLDTGLIFYRRVKKHLESTRTPVLVLTVRLDKDIKDKFLSEGLPAAQFSTKLSLRTVSDFNRKVFTLANHIS